MQALLLSGRFRLAADYLRTSAAQPLLEGGDAEALVVSAAREYFNAATSLSDPALDRVSECLGVLPPGLIDPSGDAAAEARLVEAARMLASYGCSLLPLQVRLHPDRLQIVLSLIEDDGEEGEGGGGVARAAARRAAARGRRGGWRRGGRCRPPWCRRPWTWEGSHAPRAVTAIGGGARRAGGGGQAPRDRSSGQTQPAPRWQPRAGDRADVQARGGGICPGLEAVHRDLHGGGGEWGVGVGRGVGGEGE